MNRKAVIYISVGFLAACALLALFFLIRKPEKITPPVLQETEKKVLSFKDVRYTGERKGETDWEITASLAKKHIDKPVVEMENVKGSYKPKAGSSISFTGAKSTLDIEKEQGSIDNVEIVYNNEYTLKSDAFKFDFKKNTANTLAPVSIDGPKFNLNGTGLTANIREEIVSIDHNVSGSVATQRGRMRFTSSRLVYKIKEGLYILEGGVHMRGDQLDVQCGTLYIYGSGNNLEKMVARGKVRLTSKRITARGESAVYYFKEGKVVSGSPLPGKKP